jgi:hypothetical protein
MGRKLLEEVCAAYLFCACHAASCVLTVLFTEVLSQTVTINGQTINLSIPQLPTKTFQPAHTTPALAYARSLLTISIGVGNLMAYWMPADFCGWQSFISSELNRQFRT